MPNLTLKNIDKIYPGGVQAVYDFNIDIEHGDFVVLVGPSGCGKSTVLRMVAGLEIITKGDMHLGDKRINDVAPADRDISMVFQNYALYGHMSVYQNMGFSQIIRHESSDSIHEKVMKASDIVELNGQLNRFPRNLSGGQRQRVALGRSIVSSASIILLDEPLSNLDAKLRGQARQELTKLHRQLGSTFVYVTHDQTEAMTMADRIVVMDAGRVQQIGTPEEVYHWPENIFVGGFIGNPPMNFIDGRIENGRFVAPGMSLRVSDGLLPVMESRSDKSVVMGLRAEFFSTEPNASHEAVCGEVVKSEFLGNHSLVYLQNAEYEFVANLQQYFTNSNGDMLELYLDMDRVHFFDPESETRIRAEGGR
ncbi:MAG: ATP-binding cassette domain-containing protein [Chloroflexi bacterium]|nr:MAG: ATP-binding cassette domain-containing protein [Chloroflexota bacterium]